jgi:hypothetical protein
MINKHESKFFGTKLVDYVPNEPIKAKTVPRLVMNEYRASEFLGVKDTFEALRKDPRAKDLEAIAIGPYNESYDDDASKVIKELTSAASKKLFTKLRAVFLGDIIGEEQEISWIHVGNPGKILDAYPELERLQVRGTESFKFKCAPHDALKSLVIESGGLPKAVIKGVIEAGFANLEELELWLGSENYGANHTVDDLMPILSGLVFPKLRRLALRNCEYTDQIAVALADAPVLGRITELDLSMGTLGDDGANALLGSPLFARLESVDLSHHYMSPAVMKKIAAAGPKVITKDRLTAEDEEGDRYIQVAE